MAALRRQTSEKSSENERARELRRQLGTILKSWRENKPLTQADLAAALGLKYYSFVSQVENGLGRIPQNLYIPWADALGIDHKTFCWCVLAHVEPSLYAELSRHDASKAEAWSN